jgi:hypothetical protein
MTRDEKTQAKYQKTLAKIEGCPLCWRLRKGKHTDEGYCYIINSDFPYKELGGRKVKYHYIVISKKCEPTPSTRNKMFNFALELEPDSIIINQDHHSSIPDHFHIHLIWTSKNTKTKPKSSLNTHKK